MSTPRQNLSIERLRIAERCLISAAADRPELLTDDNWQHAMGRVYAMLKDDYEPTRLPAESTAASAAMAYANGWKDVALCHACKLPLHPAWPSDFCGNCRPVRSQTP